MVPDKLDPLVADELELLGLKADIIIRKTKTLYRHDLDKKPLMEMPDNSPCRASRPAGTVSELK